MGVSSYFKTQCHVHNLSLEHEDASDFYLSCWQRNRTTLPLLCIKTVLFLACIGILVWSFVLTGLGLGFGMWFIFMTHWGLVLVTLTTGFAFAVSCRAYLKGPIESNFGMPWYVKTYWAVYNITVPIAFFITVFYYALLSALDEEFAIDPVLDFFIHGMNSIVMLILLLVSRHPTYLLHFYFPVAMGLVYLVFSLIYYFAGGLGPFGSGWIYPNLDWSAPGATTVMVVLSALAILIIHGVVVGLAELRDYVTKRYRRDSKTISIS